MAETYNTIRSYEISIWTLQDRFLSVLKWANMSQKGQLQDPEMTLRDDGTEELTFTIPKFYWSGPDKIPNPMWLQVKKEPIEANMHKLKVIFNKNDENERVFEFLVVSVDSGHTNDEVDISVKAEGLAFHELGKVGYKISLSQTNYELDLEEWINDGMKGPKPEETIQYWNDKLFVDARGNQRTNWTYEVQMDWSSYSQGNSALKDPHKVYEDEYVSSWQVDEEDDTKLLPKYVEGYKEKWRPIEVSASNLYNITQQIAEQFGVFCRYQYDYDENYQIIGRRVIYYNNYIKDKEGHIDLTYPYSSTSITRSVDNSQVTTKLYVQNVDNDTMGTISIMEVDANKSKEDYLLCFDYMRDVEGVNEDQYAEIAKYEAQMHQYNANLIKIQERIRVISDQLVDLEAKAKVYENSLVEDGERKNEAHAGYMGLTDGQGRVKYDTPCTVMEDQTYGRYVNIYANGVIPNTIHLYKESNYTAMKDESQYKGFIEVFTPDLDETKQYAIRLRNIQYAGLSAGDIIYLSAEREPYSYYTALEKLWDNRTEMDKANLEKTNETVALYNWYLTGSRVGYGKIGSARADGSYEGLAITAPFDDPVLLEEFADAHPFVSWVADHMRAGDPEDTNYDIDAFLNHDISSLSADLYYFQEYFLDLKSLLSDKFERMMGPALREGYWQPDDYHDYGDMYESTFKLSAAPEMNIKKDDLDGFISGSLVQALARDEQLSPHMQVIWDCNKYYDNETPLVYESSISGRKDQHLIVDISENLDFVKNHLDDLCFIYSDRSCVQTIYDIQENKVPNFAQYLKSFHNGIYPDPKTNEPVIESNNHSYFTKMIALINRISHTETDKKANPVKGYFNAIGALKAAAEAVRTENGGANATPYHIIDEILDYNDLTPFVNKLQNFIDKLSNISNELSKLEDAYSSKLMGAKTDEKAFIEAELVKIQAAHEYLAYVDSQVMSGQNTDITIGEPNSENYTTGDRGLLIIMRQYLVYLQWIESLEKNRFQYYQINSGCELGWLIDTNPQFNPGQPITYKDVKRIPVLIITGADVLDDDTIRYLVKGEYVIYHGEGNQQETTYSDPVIEKYRPFLGYYTTTEQKDSTTGSTYTERVLNYGPSISDNQYIGAGADKEDTQYFTRNLTKHLYGTTKQPDAYEYRYRRVYPRIYFNTLKLKSESSDIHLSMNEKLLEDFKDYSLVPDDRSKGQKLQGIGYYLTIKPHLLFKNGKAENEFKIVYTLSNADISIYLDALKVLRENAYPKVSYNVDVSILNSKFIATAYDRLNQIVHINDIDLQLEDANGYISSITMNLDHPWEDQVEIKNYETKFEDLFTTIVAQTEAMQRSQQGLNSVLQAFSRTTGLLDKDVLERSLVSANLKLKFDTAGRVTSDENGIMAISEDEKSAIAFRPGGIFTAYEHDVNGEWIWNTGILPTGISANFISGGQLDINKIKLYAGDQLRFQMNSDGLFAYKSFSTNHAKKDFAVKQDIAEEDIAPEKTDFKQYVVFNSEGLFLTAKQGALYNTQKMSTGDNQIKYQYAIAQKDINRVEISWDGLKLRNWAGDEVFYADPDTGNLTLSGTIRASAGQIGGWNIHNSALESTNSRLILNSGYGENQSPSIALSDRMLATTKIYNNVTYYIYKQIGDTSNQLYYSPILKYDEQSFSDFNDELYIEDEEIISVSPKYFYIETMPRQSSDIGMDDSNQDSDLTVVTHIYIASDGNGSGSIIYFDLPELEQPLPLEYDGDTSKDANWYKVLQSMSPPLNLKEIITTITTQVLVKANTVEHPIANNTKFTLDGVEAPVFLIEGSNVENGLSSIAIKRGQIGNFDITTNGLFNGILDSSIKIGYNGRITSLGDCIVKIVSNTQTGRLEFYNAKGEIINFNVAETQFYKDAISAVQDLKVTHTIKGKTIIFKATVGNKQTGTKSITYPVTISDSGGSSGGSSDSCNSSCSGGCSNACTGTCSGGCLSSCTGNCDGSCKGGCKNSCGTTCNKGCATTCSTQCYRGVGY